MITVFKKYITPAICFFLILASNSCNQKKKREPENSIKRGIEFKGFDYLKDFDTNRSIFTAVSYQLDDFSADGGELTIYYATEQDYRVFDFWLFGETGKLNYTFWVDSLRNFKFIKQMKFVYDKPYYEEGFMVDTVLRYLSYEQPSAKLFDEKKQPIPRAELRDSTKIELESFFEVVTSEITFPK